MYDIVRKLRSQSVIASYDWVRKNNIVRLCEQAADEIERLQKRVKELENKGH